MFTTQIKLNIKKERKGKEWQEINLQSSSAISTLNPGAIS